MLIRTLPYIWYPLFSAAAIAAFALMLAAGAPLAAAAYLPVIAVGIVIVVLEWKCPEHLEWRPRASDIGADAAFMAFVQVALPQALAAIVVLALAAWTSEHARSALWPHHWPLAAQAIAVVLLVDFTRYWLHRACHRYPLLWRLHEVHHSPDILYVLNVGRFHPIEKALHFSLDSAPFIALGVAPEVLACYFLLYSVNGLFQHSNVRLRYGWLNYVVGSAETHRWHHARDPKTAYCNFSNTTIVWDLVFGTWRLPPGPPIRDIGIPDRGYPKSFWAQLWMPFRAWLSARSLLANAAIDWSLRLTRCVEGRRIAALVRDPMSAQRAVLERIVRANARTTFGRRYDFASLAGIDDYVRRVPVHEHEALRPDISAQIERGEAALTAELPARYARTSGTTGAAKDVPLTASYLRDLQRIHRTSVAYQHRVCPEAFKGGIVAIVSPAQEGVLANGKPYGSASGMVAGDTPRIVRGKFVVPGEVLTIADSRLKYLTILRRALERRDITYLGAANPSTLLALMRLYREHERELLEELRRTHPDRVAELERLRARGELRMCDLWPELRLVVTWTCAGAGIAVDAVRRELAPRTRILELGYVASEFRGTITIGRRAGSGLPTADTHFFEFVERDAWDRGEPEYLTLDRLRKGFDYYVIVTTPSGLYRYFINDLVRVTGFLHRMPLLRFVQKGKGITNITGEKLYEAQVLTAVRDVMASHGSDARFVMMLADEAKRLYRLYVEPGPGSLPSSDAFGDAVDARLRGCNLEYEAKRESERLGRITAKWLRPGTGEAHKQFCVARGQREGQFKAVAIAYAKDFAFELDTYVDERGALSAHSTGATVVDGA